MCWGLGVEGSCDIRGKLIELQGGNLRVQSSQKIRFLHQKSEIFIFFSSFRWKTAEFSRFQLFFSENCLPPPKFQTFEVANGFFGLLLPTGKLCVVDEPHSVLQPARNTRKALNFSYFWAIWWEHIVHKHVERCSRAVGGAKLTGESISGEKLEVWARFLGAKLDFVNVLTLIKPTLLTGLERRRRLVLEPLRFA